MMLFAFEDQPQLRKWAKGYDVDGAWLPIDRHDFDLIAIKEDRAGGEVRLWIKMLVANERRKDGVLCEPKMRKNLLGVREMAENSIMPQKAGLIVALRGTHRIYAVRVRNSMFLDGFVAAKMVAAGTAMELDRTDEDAMDQALWFIANDDGERSPRVSARAADGEASGAQG